jgi:hypothetical protein
MRRAPLRMNTLYLLAGIALGTVTPVATADFIVYNLDQSNTLGNGVYGTVKVDADTSLGQIKLTFAAATAPYNAVGPNFGFNMIGFNTDLDLKAEQFTLPAGWKLTASSNLGSFGKFTWKGSASNQTAPSVIVQIDGLAGGATTPHFALPSAGGDSVFFAGHVMDFTLNGSDVTSHWVGGSLPPPDDSDPPPPPSGGGETPSPTPEPSGLVLGLGALTGLVLARVGYRRRVQS